MEQDTLKNKYISLRGVPIKLWLDTGVRLNGEIMHVGMDYVIISGKEGEQANIHIPMARIASFSN